MTKLQHLTRSTDLLELFNRLNSGEIITIVSHGMEDILVFHPYYAGEGEKDVMLNCIQELSQYHAHQAHNISAEETPK